jgi:hypothetical protein
MPTIVVEPAETTAPGGIPAVVDSTNILPCTRLKAPPPRPLASRDIEDLKTIVIVCGIGLAMSLLLLTYGVDLSSEFF